MQQTIQPTDILNFWTEAGGDRWFAKDAEFDGRLTIRFAQALAAARTGMLDRWADTPAGGLALVILLDQFSRNIHRGTPLMFAGDRSALHLAKTCISRGFHRAAPPHRAFGSSCRSNTQKISMLNGVGWPFLNPWGSIPWFIGRNFIST